MRKQAHLLLLLMAALALAGCGDMDLDGVPDEEDNCPFVANPEQADSDANGVGDTCQFVPKDTDGDGVDDSQDNCRYAVNAGQADGDGDGVGDACDDAMRETIVAVLDDIARDDTEGRLALRPGNALARSRLVDRLTALGVTPAGETPGSYDQPFYSGVNLVGIFEPPGTAGQPPRVLLGAHHDHMGDRYEYGCFAHPDAESNICNGASDNAAAVAVVFAALEALMPTLEVPVAVAFWDAEEWGKLGAYHWVENPTFDTSALRLYINLDVVGANLFIGGEEHTFAIGAESGGADLVADLVAATGVTPLQTTLFSTALGQGRSDHEPLRAIVPFVFFSDATGPSYHTTADEISRLNLDKAVEIARMTADLAERALARPAPYPMSPVNPDLPVYTDAEPIRDAIVLGLTLADANGLDLETRLLLEIGRNGVERIVARGPGLFSLLDQASLGLMALYLLDVSMGLPFIPPP